MQSDSLRPSDADIVRQIVDGNVNAFESLVTRYEVLVLKIVKKHVPPSEVEETVQNVFVQAYRSLSTFKGKSHFSQWLSSIAIRACYDYWRRAYRSQEVPMCALTEKHRKWLDAVISEESERGVDEEGSQKEARELLDFALATLSAEDRMVLELVYLEGLSVKEAAGQLGWSTANVKVRSFRARKKLQKLLREIMQEGRKRP
jgi:RNA polymerase sigma-70 factor (ECF subfamily)